MAYKELNKELTGSCKRVIYALLDRKEQTYDGAFRVWENEEQYIVAALLHDPYPQNPIEDWDGNGKILRAFDREERKLIEEAIGFYSIDPPVTIDQAEERFTKAVQKLSAVYSLVEDIATPDDLDELEGILNIFLEEVDNCKAEKERYTEKYRVPLDLYDHSGQKWYVGGEAWGQVQYPQWDLSRNAGMWIPDKTAREHIESFPEDQRMAKAIGLARDALRLYNAYIGGDVWDAFIWTIPKTLAPDDVEPVDRFEIEAQFYGWTEAKSWLDALQDAPRNGWEND